MRNILVAIPFRATLAPWLRHRMDALADGLAADYDGHADLHLDLVRYGNLETYRDADENQYAPHARARNALLAEALRSGHDLVLWIDADLTYYPPRLPELLLQRQPPGGVVAPQTLIEGTTQFYDTYGMRYLDGGLLDWGPPYFRDAPRLGAGYQLAAVGCCYLIPAAVYRAGARYAPTPNHTEHWTVMQAVAATGAAIICTPEVTVYHADLPQYRLNWHSSARLADPGVLA